MTSLILAVGASDWDLTCRLPRFKMPNWVPCDEPLARHPSCAIRPLSLAFDTFENLKLESNLALDFGDASPGIGSSR